MNNNYHIGCSGYYYSSWKNKFYPAGLQPKDWLTYYGTIFNSVELNGTFYRTPKISDLIKYAEVTPRKFTFSVKMSKYITHVLHLKDSKQHISDFQDLIKEGLADKLSCFLFQLPPSFHYSEENLEQIIMNVPKNPDNILEFRHESWWNEHTQKAFSDAQLTFCNIDYPGLRSKFMHTTSVFYLRLHGNPQLFKSEYTKAQLRAFYKRIPQNAERSHIYFNNTFYEAGYTNALQLMEIIDK